MSGRSALYVHLPTARSSSMAANTSGTSVGTSSKRTRDGGLIASCNKRASSGAASVCLSATATEQAVSGTPSRLRSDQEELRRRRRCGTRTHLRSSPYAGPVQEARQLGGQAGRQRGAEVRRRGQSLLLRQQDRAVLQGGDVRPEQRVGHRVYLSVGGIYEGSPAFLMREMDAGDAIIIAAFSFLLIPFVSRLRRFATRAFIFSVKWAASAAFVAVFVAMLSKTAQYAAFKRAVLHLGNSGEMARTSSAT